MKAPKRVEEQKSLPFHAQSTRHRRGDGAQPENKPRPEDRCPAVAVDLVFRHRHVLTPVQLVLEPAQKMRAQPPANPETAIISQHRGGDAHQNDDGQRKLIVFVRQKAGQYEHRFPGAAAGPHLLQATPRLGQGSPTVHQSLLDDFRNPLHLCSGVVGPEPPVSDMG